MKIPISQIDKFKEAPIKVSIRNHIFTNKSRFWPETYYHGNHVWDACWSIIKGSAGKSRKQIRNSLQNKVRSFGSNSVDEIMSRYIDELIYIDGEKYLSGKYGGPTKLSKYSRWRHEYYFEDNILKEVPRKAQKRTSYSSNYQRELDPVIAKVMTYRFSHMVHLGYKYVSRRVNSSVHNRGRTLHYKNGGVHCPKRKTLEVHYITVQESVHSWLSREEYLQSEIDRLQRLGHTYNRAERRDTKEKIERYKQYIEAKPWRDN